MVAISCSPRTVIKHTRPRPTLAKANTKTTATMFSRRSSAAEPEAKKGSRAEADEDTPTKELRSYFAQLRAKSGLPGLDKSKNFLEKSKTFQRYGLYAIALICVEINQ